MKRNRKILVLLITIIIVVVAALILFITSKEPTLSKEEIIQRFVDNKEIFIEIQKYDGDYNGNEYYNKITKYQEISNGNGISRAGDMIWFVMDNERGGNCIYKE